MKYLYSILCAAVVFFVACGDDKDYLIDGGVSSPYLNMTTYDFLASNPLFDSLRVSIDKAGLKDRVNAEGTLFAVTNFSFKNYIDEMTTLGRAKYNDPNYFYAYDSIPVSDLQNLVMYLFPEKIQRADLRKEGDIFTNLGGTELRISLEPQKDYTDQLTNNPEYVYLTYKQGDRWDDWDATVTGTEQDTKERIQTSGLISTNGIIHVVSNEHNLFFYKK
ncbi:hypothetical protein AGMMS4957_02170 [Bacteroidia bacterium]|nr:hypothetical protein AGMMS4957_02170 [Bacteroidia bacterium]